MLVRSDAVAFDPAPYFTADLDGMYVLGGDQTVAMNTVHDTPLEDAMTAAFEAGAVFGGNSAGDAVQSRDMINGYYGNNGPAESLQRGRGPGLLRQPAPTDCEGGLPFGFPNLITDQHVFEYGRTGRSLNVSVSTGKPVLGMDAATGAVVTDYTHLRDVTGDTLGYVIDPDAYGATATYGGPNDTLRTRRRRDAPAAARLRASTSTTMTPSQDGTPIAEAGPSPAATYPTFATAPAPGRCSSRAGSSATRPGFVGDAFVGGRRWRRPPRIVVLAAGYAKSGDAQADAKAIAAALAPSVASVVLVRPRLADEDRRRRSRRSTTRPGSS